jgi:hypothetical protein
VKQIEPALSVEEWAAFESETGPGFKMLGRLTFVSPDQHWQRIAITNALLPDDDPRKITRVDVEEVRKQAIIHSRERTAEGWQSYLHTVADKLAALLPPADR